MLLSEKVESRINEVKYEFGCENYFYKDFRGTETTLKLVFLAYKLFSLFTWAVSGSNVQHHLNTPHFMVFAVACSLNAYGKV